VFGAPAPAAPVLPLPLPLPMWPYGQGSPFGERGAGLCVVLGAVEVCAGGVVAVEDEDEPLPVAAPAPAMPAAAPAVAHAAAMAPAFTIRLMLTRAPSVDLRMPLQPPCRARVGET
jgi:hypothetical protein